MRRATGFVLCLVLALSSWAQEPRTEITKWQDGKQAAISLTFDDSTENHFRIAVPLLNERGMKATFFVITAEIPDSRYSPKLIGRPVMDIIRESGKIATNKDNVLERTTMLRYLRQVQEVPAISDFNPQRAGRAYEREQYAELFPMVDAALAKLRASGQTYHSDSPPIPGKYNAPKYLTREGVSWEDFRRYAAQGHEFGSHTVSHPYMSALDEANNVYEIEASVREIGEKLGSEHTFSIECPNGIHDPRLIPYVRGRVPLARNWVFDDFMDGIMRGDERDPGTAKNAYVQWQRGPLSKTPFETMTGWVEKSVDHGLWLVLVIQGIEGIGWEALPTERVRAYCDYIKQREDRIWVATIQEGAKYARERMSSKVTSRRNGNAIEVSVSHSLDPKLYNLPLTAKTTIPNDWKVVRLRQGGSNQWLPVHRTDGETYVQYRISPDGTTATLESGAN
ncbi:MAG: polysaccharide deacetylase family protein [Candidatus Korobacteraceae bacterium]